MTQPRGAKVKQRMLNKRIRIIRLTENLYIDLRKCTTFSTANITIEVEYFTRQIRTLVIENPLKLVIVK